MNRYPVWKWAILVIVLLVGALYSLPNFFGETPAVQVSAVKSGVKIDDAVAQRVEQALAAASLTAERVAVEGTSVRARFDTLENQLKAKDVIQKALVPDANDPSFVVALNQISRTPAWLSAIHARPMFLGLDLRGGTQVILTGISPSTALTMVKLGIDLSAVPTRGSLKAGVVLALRMTGRQLNGHLQKGG